MPLPGTEGDRLFELTVSLVRQGNCEEKNLPPKLLIHSPQLWLFFFLETFVGCALWGSLITLSLAFTPLKSDPTCQPKSKVTPDTDYHELRLGPRWKLFPSGATDALLPSVTRIFHGHSLHLFLLSPRMELYQKQPPPIKARTWYGSFSIHCYQPIGSEEVGFVLKP